MFSQVNGGLSDGYLVRNNFDATAGPRFGSSGHKLDLVANNRDEKRSNSRASRDLAFRGIAECQRPRHSVAPEFGEKTRSRYLLRLFAGRLF
jgi:hypothetical protein